MAVPMSFGGRGTFDARRRRNMGNSHHTHDTASFSSSTNLRQQQCEYCPSTDIRSLSAGCFLDHYIISSFQTHCTWHISETELDTISPYVSNSFHALPFSFPSHLLIVVCQFHSPFCFNSLVDKALVVNFDLLFFIFKFCKLNVCVVECCVTMQPPSLGII